MKAVLRAGNEDWQVWTGWYEDRLAGRVREEARELAYVRIGDEMWDQGPAAVNTEIKRRIEALEPPQTTPPAPIENIPSAVSFGWTSHGTISVAAGTQNRPVFPFPGGEKDHADRLDTCRTLAIDTARLLWSGRYNARREYAEELEI